MRKRFTCMALIGAAIGAAFLAHSVHVWATPAIGFKSTSLASGTFAEFEVLNQSAVMNPGGDVDNDRDDKSQWMSLQKTKGASDLYVQSNTWEPVNSVTGAAASTGWHTHHGHSLIIVTAGTIAEYDSDCVRHTYTFVPGQPSPTLVDPGHGHVHVIRNEGTVPASTIAVQLVPYDPNKANRRVDVPTAPPSCAGMQ